MQLKSNVVPTIFDHLIKRKTENVVQNSNTSVDPPAKRHKSENKDENISLTKGQIFLTSASLQVKPTFRSQYRLIIQIDKIRSKPGPKSKKLLHLTRLKKKLKSSNNTQQPLKEASQQNLNDSVQQNLMVSEQNRLIKSYQHRLNDLDQPSLKKSDQNRLKDSNQSNPKTSVRKSFQQLINSNEKLARCENGCQLQKVIWNANPAFKCKKCSNIYIPQPIINESNEVYNQCLTCNQTFQTSEMLYSHIKEHLTCDICYCLFRTQFEYKNHMRLHTNMNPSTPFQCHLCDLEFNTKINIRNHLSVVHKINPERISPGSQQIFLQCKFCNLNFKTEENLRNHMDSHKDKDNSVLPVGRLRSVKFSCAVCSMEFTTLAEIDAHTKTHMTTNTEDLRCKICRKVFTNDRVLSDHLREHVARAYRCHLCPKAFINKTSLQTHLQNHA